MSDAKTETTLKPCPFCRNRVIWIEVIDFSNPYAICRNCGAMGPVADGGDTEAARGEAERLWNQRPDAPPYQTTTPNWASNFKGHVMFWLKIIAMLGLMANAQLFAIAYAIGKLPHAR